MPRYTAKFFTQRTGWLVTDEGRQYLVMDVVQKTGWTEIDGLQYYLDSETGYAALGIARAPYPTGYSGNPEDVQYAQEHGIAYPKVDSGLFVFDETTGAFQNTLTRIITTADGMVRYAEKGELVWHPGMVESEGAYYYFLGCMEDGGNVAATGDTYISRNKTKRTFNLGCVYTFGEDSKLCEYDGITSCDGILRYYKDAQLMLGAGLIQVHGNYYYVRSNGELVVNSKYWISNVNGLNVKPGSYDFDENGVLQMPVFTDKNGVYQEGGNWYYYVDGTKTYSGLVNVNTVWHFEDGTEQTFQANIYVRSNGQLATGKYWVTNTNGLRDPGFLQFDELGKAATLEVKNGIYQEDNTLYYYVNGSKAYAAGVVELDGSYYYVRSNGELVYGRGYWITNVGDSGIIAKCYQFDADGKMLNPEFVKDDLVNGVVDGYYYVNGAIAYGAGLVRYQDGYIYVCSDGHLATGMYWVTNNNNLLPQGLYNFGSDGILLQ